MTEGNLQTDNKVRSEEMKIKELEAEIIKLKENLKDYERQELEKTPNQLYTSSSNSIVKEMVEQILGKKFTWRLIGFGRFQTVELKVPENLEDPSVGYDENLIITNDKKTGEELKIDGRPRYRKPHPLAGQIQGDIRSFRLQDEAHLRKCLESVKQNVLNRFKLEGKNLPIFD